MYDASDRKQVRRAEKADAIAVRNRGAAVKRLMAASADREFVWNFLESLNVFSTPYADNPYQVYFMLGEQNAGKRLLSDIMQFCPDEYVTMTREANGRRTVSSTIDATERSPGEQLGSEEPGGGLEGDSGPAEPDLFDGEPASQATH